MTQKEIIQLLQREKCIIKASVYEKYNDINIKDITYNSKSCTKDCAFFVKGANFKKEYIIEAINNGAILIISEEEYSDIDVGLVVVNDIRTAMVLIAENFFGQAYKEITVVGLTGTKGKTTTATYIHNILNLYNGKRTGLLSTIETYTGKRKEESHLSTPEAVELQRYISEAKDEDLKYLTMEVSSQATKTKRILNMMFDIGVFLNISEDHISPAEHPNFNDYLNCKLEFLKKCESVVLNYNTDCLETVLHAVKDVEKVITYGDESVKEKVDCYYKNVRREGQFLKFIVINNDQEFKYRTKMLGNFNVENAVAAIMVARQLKIPEEYISKGIEQTTVSGRMNIFNGKNKTIIVDYAHNKLSFEKLFEAVKKDYPKSEIVALFGAPGGKAYGRRKDMAQVTSKYATKVYFTADDPQFEKVRDICNELATYTTIPYEIIEDRKEAIKYAYSNMKENGVLCLLAKGEDRYQQVNGRFEEYDSDIDIALNITK